MAEQVKLTRRQNVIQFFKFTFISASAGIIQFGSFTLMNELIDWTKIIPGMVSWPETFQSEYGPSYFIALVLSVVYNFTINRKFTFKSAANIPIAMLKVFGYYCVFTPLSIWWGDALVSIGWNEYIVLAGTMVINFVTEFLFTRFVVYHNQIFTSEAGKAELEKNESNKKG
jgi:putative flippase GtrA